MITTRLGRFAALAGLVTVTACAPSAATSPSPAASGPATCIDPAICSRSQR